MAQLFSIFVAALDLNGFVLEYFLKVLLLFIVKFESDFSTVSVGLGLGGTQIVVVGSPLRSPR